MQKSSAATSGAGSPTCVATLGKRLPSSVGNTRRAKGLNKVSRKMFGRLCKQVSKAMNNRQGSTLESKQFRVCGWVEAFYGPLGCTTALKLPAGSWLSSV